MIVESTFRPSPWLPGAHLQTLYPALFRPRFAPFWQTQRLELPDGDFLDVAEVFPESAQPPRGLVVLFHGLEGSIHSHYAGPLMKRLQKAGYQTLFLHFRNCSEEANRLNRSYHSGETGDIDWVLNWASSRYPGLAITALGFSLGGNALLKYLGEDSSRSIPLRSAIAVSAPFLLEGAADRLEQGLSRLYQAHLLRHLRHSTLAKFATRPAPIDLRLIPKLKTFRDFDDQVTAPLHGFAGVADYYQRSSCRQYLAGIAVPTLILHARDDPFMSPSVIPGSEELSASTVLELSAHGGHVGFVGTDLEHPHPSPYWLDERILRHLQNL